MKQSHRVSPEGDRRSLRPYRTPVVRVQRPSNEEMFLADSGPLDLEIGCGVGMHPLNRARRFPKRRLVAIEHTKSRFTKFQNSFREEGSPANLLPVNANAVGWLSQLDLREKFEHVFLLYPNPNPLNSAQRWFKMPFFQKLLQALRPGGSITLATDQWWYLEEARIQAEKIWNLTVLECGQWKGSPRTHFEKKYLERGEPCYHLKVRKAGGELLSNAVEES